VAVPADVLVTVLAASTPVDDLSVSTFAWVALIAFIVAVLLLDLFVFHRDAHVIEFREAAISSAIYMGIGLAFGLVVLMYLGSEASAVYYAGFVVEKSLSIDNVFVWAVIFGFFATPPEFQHRVLFWGVFGALVMRAIFIVVGAALLEQFDWMVFVFGTVLLITAVQLFRHRGDHQAIDLDRNPFMRLARKVIPSTDEYHGQKFTIIQAGKRVATPLLFVLVAVELTDLVFAIDSVPAILAITTNVWIVFAANAFALLGLRALYFLLAGMVRRFRYLDVGLAVLLLWVGVKMYYQGFTDDKVPIAISLPVIVAVVGIAIAVSMLTTREKRAAAG
jgi:tellurite resistance protein TerC